MAWRGARVRTACCVVEQTKCQRVCVYVYVSGAVRVVASTLNEHTLTRLRWTVLVQYFP